MQTLLCCWDVFLSEFDFRCFISRVARDPINQHVYCECSEPQRVHGSHTDDALLFSPLSFNYLFSCLSELGPTQGNDFFYEVKCEISGTELLMQYRMALTMAFSQVMDLYKNLSYLVSVTLGSYITL